MNVEKLKKLLSDVKKGKTDTVRALDILKTLPFEETEFVFPFLTSLRSFFSFSTFILIVKRA